MSESPEVSPERRKFLARLSIGLGCIGAALIGVPVAGFLLGPLFESVARKWRGVGAADTFPERRNRRSQI